MPILEFQILELRQDDEPVPFFHVFSAFRGQPFGLSDSEQGIVTFFSIADARPFYRGRGCQLSVRDEPAFCQHIRRCLLTCPVSGKDQSSVFPVIRIIIPSVPAHFYRAPVGGRQYFHEFITPEFRQYGRPVRLGQIKFSLFCRDGPAMSVTGEQYDDGKQYRCNFRRHILHRRQKILTLPARRTEAKVCIYKHYL